MVSMQKVFLDFDNTIVESNKRIIELLNEKYGLNKTEDDLTDYYYTSICDKVKPAEIEDLFGSKAFFENLEFKPFILETFRKYEGKYDFIITTKGNEENLKLKEQWIREHLSKDVKFLGLSGNPHDKKRVNMKKGIQIDDNAKCLRTNADVHILYKDYHSFPWQKGYTNEDILVVDEWKQIDEILDFFSRYNSRTLREKGE